ncbi:MAG: hypothetical protein IKH50_05850, partial [Oscillospiraceae bacterium]|nr:hypothetical protein [Oscillospiraceae bacterium]
MFRKKHRRELASYSMIASLAGLALAFIGWCWGYAQKGEDFWFYRKYKQHYISEETPGEWDKISEDGKYIDNNGNKYPWFCRNGIEMSDTAFTPFSSYYYNASFILYRTSSCPP